MQKKSSEPQSAVVVIPYLYISTQDVAQMIIRIHLVGYAAALTTKHRSWIQMFLNRHRQHKNGVLVRTASASTQRIQLHRLTYIALDVDKQVTRS